MRTNITIDTDTIRRIHSIAKELASLADSLGRHERVEFTEAWPESLDPKEVQRMLLPLYLGMTSQDEKLVVDLARLPHLLVGGASGQGKTNLLTSMICGLARLLPPEQLRFVLYDPKCVEFLQYSALPHLAFPVITDGYKIVHVLRWLVDELAKRLKEFTLSALNARISLEKKSVGSSRRSKSSTAVPSFWHRFPMPWSQRHQNHNPTQPAKVKKKCTRGHWMLSKRHDKLSRHIVGPKWSSTTTVPPDLSTHRKSGASLALR